MLSNEVGGEPIQRLGSSKCAPGEFSGLRVGTAQTDAAPCTCEASCDKQCTDNPGEHSECKCLPTGWGKKCVTCPPGLCE